MIICFKCSRETKEQLDDLVSRGGFLDLSEAIAVAIANQILLTKSTENAPFVGGAVAKDHPRNVEKSSDLNANNTKNLPLGAPRVSSIFRIKSNSRVEPVAPSPQSADGSSSKERISQAHWIFGQHNKLLPVKASCRAVANLLGDAPSGVEVEEVARLVANSAGELGAYLQSIDKKFNRERDEMLATAFPGRTDPDKGRIRYANQFVVGITKQGQLTGLLVDLALINKLSPESRKIALTEAGWQFALMRNPVMDGGDENPAEKLSSEERAFLITHITNNVISERSAYLQVLGFIHSGHNNPEALRAAFNEIERETPKNKLYFSTQRAGAISRMVDIGLLRRDRHGTRVTYAITDDGVEFLNK